MSTTLCAGGATGDITPTQELPNYTGSTCRPDNSALPLLAQAVALGDDHTTVVIVACDLLTIDRPLALRLRDVCARRTGLPGDHFVLAATHTALAPVTTPGLVTGPLPDPRYLDLLEERVADTVVRALKTLTPAVIVAGETPSPGFELNRRSIRPDGGIAFTQWGPGLVPEGLTDPTLTFLGFETPDGVPLALVSSYACHNITQSPFEDGHYNPDFFGRMSARLRESFPSALATPVLAGAQGDIVFGDRAKEAQLYGREFAQRGGRQCADAITAAYSDARRKAISSIRFASRVVEIADRTAAESTYCDDGCRGTSDSDLSFAHQRYEPERRAVEERGATRCAVEVTALSLGDAALVTNAGKLFAEDGLRIRNNSPFSITMVANLANGACGYIPTASAFQHGGYETHRTVYTSRLAKNAGDIVVRSCVNLLEDIFSSSRPSVPDITSHREALSSVDEPPHDTRMAKRPRLPDSPPIETTPSPESHDCFGHF